MANTEDWVTLKGFPKYRVGRDENGTVRVWSIRFKRLLRYTESSPGVRSVLMSDFQGVERRLTQGAVTFLLEHPAIGWHDLDLTRYMITPDGRLASRTGLRYRRQYSLFQSVDDALDTCIMIKEFTEGNLKPVYSLIHTSKEAAIGLTSRLCRWSPVRLEEVWDDAVDLFLSQLRDMNIRQVKPLFGWLCTCLRTTYRKRRHTCLNNIETADRQAAREELQY